MKIARLAFATAGLIGYSALSVAQQSPGDWLEKMAGAVGT